MRHHKVVTARELARRTAALLDEVQSEGAPVLVTRNGLPAATIHPIDDAPLRPFFVRGADSGDTDEVDVGEQSLDDIAQDVLLGVRRRLAFDDIVATSGRSASDVTMALARLEIGRLISKQLGGYVLTIRGKRVADALRERRAL